MIADGSKPIVRRHGIVIAQRKRELPKRPITAPPLPKPKYPLRFWLRDPEGWVKYLTVHNFPKLAPLIPTGEALLAA